MKRSVILHTYSTTLVELLQCFVGRRKFLIFTWDYNSSDDSIHMFCPTLSSNKHITQNSFCRNRIKTLTRIEDVDTMLMELHVPRNKKYHNDDSEHFEHQGKRLTTKNRS